MVITEEDFRIKFIGSLLDDKIKSLFETMENHKDVFNFFYSPPRKNNEPVTKMRFDYVDSKHILIPHIKKIKNLSSFISTYGLKEIRTPEDILVSYDGEVVIITTDTFHVSFLEDGNDNVIIWLEEYKEYIL